MTTSPQDSLGPLGLSSEFAAINERVRAIEEEPLERVVWRLVEQEGCTEEDARALRAEFLRFFSIAFVSEKQISPSPLVDKFWHAFILHTRDYEDFCKRHLGHFFHHEPKDHTHTKSAKDPSPGVFTKEMIEKMFPAHDKATWKELAICSNSHCDRVACRRA